MIDSSVQLTGRRDLPATLVVVRWRLFGQDSDSLTMKSYLFILGSKVLSVAVPMLMGGLIAASAADVLQPDPGELDKLAAKMDSHPLAIGPSITNRAAWESAAARPALRDIVGQAEEQLKTPVPEMTDDLYLDYSKTGNRRRGELVLFGRRNRISLFALAECIENRGRFLPALEEIIGSICKERTWVMPAHDGDLGNFLGRVVTIDLAVAMLAWDLATADSLLGDKLSPQTRTLIRQEIDRRVFVPYHRMAAGQQDQYWLLSNNNWNAVCLAGVTGAALSLIDSPKERAWYALAAAHYSRNFLSGFTSDGYCSEGVGYWNYGFGHYAALAETVRRATRGALDLLALPEAARPAVYGAQIEIVPGVCPAFADCDVNARPDPHLMAYLVRRFGAPLTVDPGLLQTRASFSWTALELGDDSAPVIKGREPWPEPGALRTWFGDATVLICRPRTFTDNSMAVAIHGGHNAEHHNHNDVGTFMVVVGNVPVLPDIGAEVYTRRTFSAQRYESRALNSYGHAVPVIGGRLQKTGQNARAVVLDSKFEDAEDMISFDIKSAYDAPTLQRLERKFVYSRADHGMLEVTDRFAFSEPTTFETALLTFGRWYKIGPSALRVVDNGKAVRVIVQTPAGTLLDLASDDIQEDLAARRKATRIALRIDPPVQAGEMHVKILPDP